MKFGKVTVAVDPGVRLPVQLNVVAVPLSILYEIVALVKLAEPLFFNVTEGVIAPGQLSPFGFATPTIEASFGFGGVQASELIKETLLGLFSNTVRIRIF